MQTQNVIQQVTVLTLALKDYFGVDELSKITGELLQVVKLVCLNYDQHMHALEFRTEITCVCTIHVGNSHTFFYGLA